MKSITKKQFRVLLTLSLAALLASAGAQFLDPSLLPRPLLDFWQANHHGRPTIGELVTGILAIPGIIMWLVGIVGLYRFWPSARRLSVLAYAYLLILYMVSPGVVLSNEVASAFSNCSTILTGIVIGIIYFSPAADWFSKRESIA